MQRSLQIAQLQGFGVVGEPAGVGGCSLGQGRGFPIDSSEHGSMVVARAGADRRSGCLGR